ncbi:MAG: RNA-binding protein [Flavobacterium sp. BFFFF2]|nr:MAG: RNA-binding protein [Flavobacterium sp. BFFFF2]
MRIDKYLWCIRLFKTRTLAADACKKNQVYINGLVAKSSREVFGGEKLKIKKSPIFYEVLVLDIPPSRVGAKLVDQFRKDITPPEVLEQLEQLRLAHSLFGRMGEGRPTKKDRRDLTDWELDHLEQLGENE